jgi:hypothetical protein
MKIVLALTVFFQGIVSHVDLSKTETVSVLPKAAHHAPYMCINSSDIVGSMPKVSYIHPPSVTNLGCPSDYQIDLHNLKVKLENINESTTTRTQGYQDHIIGLTSISTCRDLKPEVKAKTHDVAGHISSYVMYPGGRLAVERFFATMGKVPDHKPWDQPTCIGCTVSLTMKTIGGDPATVRLIPRSGREQTFTVKAAALLEVKNSPTSASGKPHWEHHYRIFDKDCKGALVTPTRIPCESFKCARSLLDAEKKAPILAAGGNPDSDVECSNSNFP